MKNKQIRILLSLIILGLVAVSCDQTRIVNYDELTDFIYVKGETAPYTGTAQKYYENGELKQVSHFKGGKLNGHFIEYDEFGERFQEGQYIDGSREGTWYMDDHENGIYTKAYFKNDEYHGEIILNYEDGRREVGTFNNGIMHGRYSSFYPNGMPKEKSIYIDGELHGKVTRWDEKGNEIYSREYYRGMPKYLLSKKKN